MPDTETGTRIVLRTGSDILSSFPPGLPDGVHIFKPKSNFGKIPVKDVAIFYSHFNIFGIFGILYGHYVIQW
jgi:hypothetical protein